MAQDGQSEQRGKRSKRQDTGRKIVIRVTDDEHARLHLEAGTGSVSNLVRKRLFGGRVRNHPVLLKVAALHTAGMRLKAVAGAEPWVEFEIRSMLAQVQRAIDDLSTHVPEDDEIEDAPA